jgi:hypothetical protein
MWMIQQDMYNSTVSDGTVRDEDGHEEVLGDE